jgi:hypothetical protein
MAFNADEYIDVIVQQIAGNFQELAETVERKKELEKKKKEFQASKDSSEYAKLSEEIKEEEENYRNIEPLTVGLFGEWGSGKTHLLKLIENKVNEFQADSKDETFPQITIPVFFNAWRFEKEEHLIIPLFQTMLAQIESYEHLSTDKKVQQVLNKGKQQFEFLLYSLKKGFKVPTNLKSTVASLLAGDLSAISEFIDTDKIFKEFEKQNNDLNHEAKLQKLLESNHIESVYMNIPQYIEKISVNNKFSFIFLIDDLDRCLPENTLKMLESIKLFLDVPSCAFVLAIDDDVVERGVEHHYRDYLKDRVRHELPITGHEYLEKMVQLPFRIPVIGTENILDYLSFHYRDKFETLLDEKKSEMSHKAVEVKELEEQKAQSSKTDEILKFFAQTIPPKPRKIKRTVMLFETKVALLKQINLERRDKLIAKITLLELFAPKLLRFIQNNGYERMYNRLVQFKTLKQKEHEEERLISLADVELIREHIRDEKVAYTTKEQQDYLKLMNIVSESRSSRMVFDLDAIFDKYETEEDLKLNIEMHQVKKRKIEEKKEESKVTKLSTISLEKLFRENDVASWGDAFKDNELLAKGEALLSKEELKLIIDMAKEKEAFRKNPEWMGIVAKYVSDEQYVELLKALYHYRFADINGQFQMGIYQVTFAEYDRYCEVKNIKKPKDEEWGRGKRPVIYVSWEDATAYAKWLTEVLEVEYRLPTEDEWYLACNNGKNSQWHFGNDKNELKEYAWYGGNSEAKTHPVGLKKPNGFGLYDMHGNVWEWCEDWYDKEKKKKVVRGGSWDDVDNVTRSAFRYRNDPTIRINSVGFRLLRTLP